MLPPVALCPVAHAVRMQVKEHAARYATSASCARNIVATEGVAALYRGFGATCARNTTFNGLYFGAIFTAQLYVPARSTGFGDAVQNLALGAAAGCFATCFKAPFDVAKSRIQAQLPRADGTLLYRHTAQTVLLVARTEGIASLWKGFVPMLARMVLGMSVSFAVFDATLAALRGGEGTRGAAAAAAAHASAGGGEEAAAAAAEAAAEAAARGAAGAAAAEG